MYIIVQDTNERIRELTNQLDLSKRRRTELEHKLLDAQNEYSTLQTNHRRSTENESTLQDQVSDLQSQVKSHIDSHNQTKVTVNDLVITIEEMEKVRVLGLIGTPKF